MHFGAKALIARIVGAERIAVQDQHAMAVAGQHLLFRQQRHTAGAAVSLAEQEIAVAVNKVDRYRQRAQRVGDLLM